MRVTSHAEVEHRPGGVIDPSNPNVYTWQASPNGQTAPGLDPLPRPDYYVSVERSPHGNYNPSDPSNATWVFGFTYYASNQGSSPPESLSLIVSLDWLQGQTLNSHWSVGQDEGISVSGTYCWSASDPKYLGHTVKVGVVVTLI